MVARFYHLVVARGLSYDGDILPHIMVMRFLWLAISTPARSLIGAGNCVVETQTRLQYRAVAGEGHVSRMQVRAVAGEGHV